VLVGIVGRVFGADAMFFANFLVTLITPAALMVLMSSRSLFTGLNPAASWRLITTVGRAYLLLCVFLFCLSSSQALLVKQILEHALQPLIEKWAQVQILAQQAGRGQGREIVAGFFDELFRMRPRFAGLLMLINAVGMYFMLIAFNMLGYVLYQHHEKLGLEVEELPSGRPASNVADAESQRIARLIADGQTDQALEIAYEAQRLAPDDLAAQERYNKLLHLAGKDDRLLNHCNKLIPLLLRREQKRSALEAWRRCRERHADYRHEDAGVVLQLAEAARANREPKLALLPEVYLLCARILSEDLREDSLAERFVLTLCNRYPQHPSAEEGMRLLDTIRRIRKASAAVSPTPAAGG
jgi:tetratricopeptide (TPR) repeat protein